MLDPYPFGKRYTWVVAFLFVVLLGGCGPAATSGPSVGEVTRVPPTTAVATATSVVVATPDEVAAPPEPPPIPSPASATPETVLPAPSPSSTSEPAAFDPALVRLALPPVVMDLAKPLFVTGAGDESGRLFIVEKGGRILIWSGSELLPTPFLDIQERVGSRSSEQGLLGLAFSPEFADSGFFFVNYTDLSGNTVVARFGISANPDRADPDSEFRVLNIEQPAGNHNGGMLAFGPDGYLYIGMGDGGGANDRFGNGQNPNTLLGKMLRLDVTTDTQRPYLVPSDNPWVGADWDGQPVLDEVWSLGLRNPWRFSFDRLTGDLWIADVGQNAYEEVNLAPAVGEGGLAGGLNFGWPLTEGQRCFPEGASCDWAGVSQPMLDYHHSAGNCSVTGGYVYRGAQFPPLQGVYLYGDYCSGAIWGFGQTSDGGWANALLLDTDLSISSFGEDDAGELYVTDLTGGGVYRIALQQAK